MDTCVQRPYFQKSVSVLLSQATIPCVIQCAMETGCYGNRLEENAVAAAY